MDTKMAESPDTRDSLVSSSNNNKQNLEENAAPNCIKPSMTVFLASFGALLGGLSMGLAVGYTAPAFLNMEASNSTILDQNTDTREHQKSLIGSTLAIGGLMGAMLAEPCNKILGRRISIIILGLPFILGWLLIALANGTTMIILGRVFTGLASGLISGIAPTYVVEIAPPQIRGSLGSCFQLMVTLGTLIAPVLGLFLTWRTLAASSTVVALVMSILMYFMPETPQWLLINDREKEAENSLSRLRSSEIKPELKLMARESDLSRSSGGSSYSCELLKSKEFYKPLLISLGLMFFQQFGGANAVLFYQSDIFKNVSADADPLKSTIWVCLAQVFATILSSVILDMSGRRILLLISGAGQALSLLAFGSYLYLAALDKAIKAQYAWTSLVSLMTFISFFSIAYGPVPWLMVPELSSSRVRSLIASIATAFTWTSLYVLTASIKPTIELIGDANAFWALAAVGATSCIFVVIFVPETKGKTTEQIQRELLG